MALPHAVVLANKVRTAAHYHVQFTAMYAVSVASLLPHANLAHYQRQYSLHTWSCCTSWPSVQGIYCFMLWM